MIRRHVGMFVLVLVIAAVSAAPVSYAQTPQAAPAYAADQLIVSLQPGYKLTSLGRLFDPQGRELRAGLHPGLLAAELLTPEGDTALLQLRPGSDVEAAGVALRGHPAVRAADPNYRMEFYRDANDALYGHQWPLRTMHVPAAWDINTGSEQVVVAVLDSGISVSHEDLQGNLIPGYNAYNGGSDVTDEDGHGTMTAGLIAAVGNNGKGISGVCWRCRILPVKIADNDGFLAIDAVIRGIRYAADHGARIINMSFGGPKHIPAIEDAINYAHSKGVLLIAAAGNEGADDNPVSYPAAYENVLSVAATNNNDQVVRFSSHGPHLDLAAPGVGVWSTAHNDGQDTYDNTNGTSFSCPHTAGVAALVISQWPELSNVQVAQLLMATADDINDPGRDDYTGYGRINALKALTAARDRVLPELPQPPQDKNPAFAPVAPAADPAVAYFPETGHTLRGAFKAYWEQNGGLPVFGYPISEEFTETTEEGTFLVQYFERERFEYHPENQPPYHVLLGRLGDDVLRQQQRDWFTFPKADPAAPHYFPETGHAIAAQFWHYWSSHGLEFGDPGVSTREALALFGLPLSEPMMETNASGDHVLTQHFERARFEYHSNNPPGYQVLLGLLGNESVDLRGWR